MSIIDNTIDKDNFNHNHNPILPKIIAKNKLNIACPATVANNPKQIILSDQDKTINGSHFLREYNLQTEFMIFFSDHAAECLRDASEWHFDGTFKSCPKLFKQILTVVAVYKEIVIPCAYILLPNKNQVTYERTFKSLYSLIKISSDELKIEKGNTDFEHGLQNAIALTFNNEKIIVKSCWFHFSQAIFKRITILGLKIRYHSDQVFKFWVRKFSALALIPLNDIEKAWDIIISETPTRDEQAIFNFIKYFHDTWLVGKHGSHCSPEIWNRHGEKIRTNNHLEGYHRKMNKALNPHSSITKVIDFFKVQGRICHTNT